MNAPAERPDQITFTERGEAALDELARALTGDTPRDPEAIAAVLDQVLHAEVDDLAAAFTAADARRSTDLRRVLGGDLAVGQGAVQAEWETGTCPGNAARRRGHPAPPATPDRGTRPGPGR